MWNVKAFSIAN